MRMSKQVTLRKPDDWHLHLRDNTMLNDVLPFSSGFYHRAIIMPNLIPPVKTRDQAEQYYQRIKAANIINNDFMPLMTCYLSDDTDAKDLIDGFKHGVFFAAKLYPAHATTNSANGVSSIDSILPVLEQMQFHGMPLLIHGEVTSAEVDIFDREARFIETQLIPLLTKLPKLKVVMEHITTKDAAEFVLSAPDNVAATVTPQHLMLNRNAIFKGGIRPHYYCLPILKKEHHRQALVNAVTSGSSRFFLGTDSAPHACERKESSCGCAGIFNSPVALQVYATVFEQADALDKLEAFCSINGPTFYGLPVNEPSITLVKKSFTVPNEYHLTNGDKLIPFMAGETLPWSLV